MKLIYFSVFVFFLTSCQTAKKDVLLEKPKDEILLDHKHFVISYNEEHKVANWVKYSLVAEKLKIKRAKRKNRFIRDPILVERGMEAVVTGNYNNSGYSRGHMAPSEDFVWDQSVNDMTFYMTNITPQLQSFNNKSWKWLEEKVRRWACFEERITVITGPLLEEKLPKIKNKISIPKKFFKVVIDETPPKKSIGFIFDQNTDQDADIKSRAISVTQLEKKLGYKLQTHIGEKLKQSHDYSKWQEKDCRK